MILIDHINLRSQNFLDHRSRTSRSVPFVALAIRFGERKCRRQHRYTFLSHHFHFFSSNYNRIDDKTLKWIWSRRVRRDATRQYCLMYIASGWETMMARIPGRSSLTIVSQIPHGRFAILRILSLIEPAADLTSQSVNHSLPTAMRDRRILSLDHKDLLLVRISRPGVPRSTILELCNRVWLAPRSPQTCHCHDNDAISRYRQHRESTHEGRGVSGGIPRTIETTLEARRCLLGLRLRTTPNPPSKQRGAPISHSFCQMLIFTSLADRSLLRLLSRPDIYIYICMYKTSLHTFTSIFY